MALKNIIFDFDGVLADTFEMNLTISQSLLPSVTVEDFIAHHDGNVHAQPVMKFTPEMVQTFREEYRSRTSALLMATTTPVVHSLAKHYRLFIISSNDEVGIKAILAEAGCENLFEAVLGYETHYSKVEKFKLCVAEYGVDLAETVFITDTVGDIKEAHKVGVSTIAVTFGFHVRERLLSASPYRICDSWDEVQTEIDKMQ